MFNLRCYSGVQTWGTLDTYCTNTGLDDDQTRASKINGKQNR